MSGNIAYKINNLVKETLKAYSFIYQNQFAEAMNSMRKAAEAICRAIIYYEYGDNDGEEIIQGHKDKNLRLIQGNQYGRKPLLFKLNKIIKEKRYINEEIFQRLEDIRNGGNLGSHDPTKPKEEISKIDAEHCSNQLRLIINWFFNSYLRQPIPNEILEAFKGIIDETLTLDFQNATWDYIYNLCEQFEKQNRYILIAPPEYGEVNLNQLSYLYKIPWSIILDFNVDSKKNGLFGAFEKTKKVQILKPLTIDSDLSQKGIIESGVSINYFFAQGLYSSPTTIASSWIDWRRKLKYPAFIRKMFSLISGQNLRRTIVIFLWNEIKYIRPVVEYITEVINEKFLELVVVNSDRSRTQNLKEEFEDYGAKIFDLPFSEFINGISRTLHSLEQNVGQDIFLVPVKKEDSDDKFEDLGKDVVLSSLDVGIEILYKDIFNKNHFYPDDLSFYKGNMITWKELSTDYDVRRNKIDDLRLMLTKHLTSRKGAHTIELFHKPGSGGTTLARRIALEFSEKYPTVIINKYDKIETTNSLIGLSEFSQKPILAIVEAHHILMGPLFSIINKINTNKKHIVFLYVKRAFSYIDDSKSSKKLFLNNHLADKNERSRFVSKYNHLANTIEQKQAIKNLEIRAPNDCEVFDFSFSIFEDDYFEDSLDRYLAGYLNKIPKNQMDFAVISSMVYFYSQESISEHMFSHLFKNGLSFELRNMSSENRFLKKLLIQELDYSKGDYSGYWKPRFDRFAKNIFILGLVGIKIEEKENWKDYISNWAIKFIEECSKNSVESFPTQDIIEILKRVFLDRDYEDPLGKDEEYGSSVISNEKFSRILRHIGDREKIKSVFKALVESFPEEVHFKGHFGRFLYETSTDQKDFEEAYNQIEQAINKGESDYNLWHLKGMCNRRLVEFLIRNFEKEHYSDEEIIEYEEFIKGLTLEAREDFKKSRILNSRNLHAYTAEIQLLLRVVEFGKSISNTESKIEFLTEKQNQWYELLVNDIFILINDANFIIEISKDIDDTKVIIRSKSMISSAEGKVFNFIGDFEKAISRFNNLAENAERNIRPYFRRMIVFSILASKVNIKRGQHYSDGWNKLSEIELDRLKLALRKNIDDEPDNPINIKLWFKAIRAGKSNLSLEEAISVVSSWKEKTATNPIANLEANYYLYILYACDAIHKQMEESFLSTSNSVKKVKEVLSEIKNNKNHNDRFSFEWLGKKLGVKSLVPHYELGRMDSAHNFFQNTEKLMLVEGVISNVYSRSNGKIKLDCGLDAFFVPQKGGFERKDETKKVKFFISFRHSELHAWEVREADAGIYLPEKVELYEIDEVEGYDNEFEDELIQQNTHENQKINEDKSIELEEEPSVNQIDLPKLPGLKVIGKIDLSKFKSRKR